MFLAYTIKYLAVIAQKAMFIIQFKLVEADKQEDAQIKTYTKTQTNNKYTKRKKHTQRKKHT